MSPCHFRAARRLIPLFLSLGAAACAATPSPWKVSGGFSMDFAHLTFDVAPLGPGLYFLHGSGGNIAALITPTGTLLVDDEFAPVAPKLKAKLAEMGAGPVKYIITTHYHPDHSGSNGFFIRDGATVIAQENCRTELLEPHYSAHWKTHSPAGALADAPTLTYKDRLTLYFGGEEIVAFHRQPAHTQGDTIVYFKHANVVHMGDVFVNLLYPYIDVADHGTIDGYFPVIDDVLALIDDHTKVVPGHGPVTDKAGLKAYRDMLKVIRDRVAAGIAKGESLETIIAGNPSKEFDPVWASDRVGPEAITAMIYQSLTGQRLDWSLPKE